MGVNKKLQYMEKCWSEEHAVAITIWTSSRNNLEFQYKRGAKDRNLEYSLTTEEFDKLVTGSCVDSLTNTRYILENCVSCCWTCIAIACAAALSPVFPMIDEFVFKRKL